MHIFTLLFGFLLLSTVSGQDDFEEPAGGQIGRGVGTAAITVDRDEYLRAHRDLTFDRNQLQMKNNILHRRLAEYYKCVYCCEYCV